MSIQRLLYNQLNTEYLYDNADMCLLLHNPWDIKTSTSASKLSLNIYSKLVSYAWAKAFAQSNKNTKFIVTNSWYDSLIAACKEHSCNEIIVMDPCESYVWDQVKNIQKKLDLEWITLEIRPNTQFLISHQKFTKKFEKPPIEAVQKPVN